MVFWAEADAFGGQGDLLFMGTTRGKYGCCIVGSGEGYKANVGEEEQVIVVGDGQEQPAVVTVTAEMNCCVSRSPSSPRLRASRRPARDVSLGG